MNQTSKKDFTYFKKQCEIWLDTYSLRDFKIYYEHNNSMPTAYAFIRPNVEAGIAVIGLSINWESQKVTKTFLKYCALHEVLHLLLADLVEVGKYRQSTDADFTRAQHAVIRRLENVAKS